MKNLALVTAAAVLAIVATSAAPAQGAVVTIDVSGAQAFGHMGDPSNSIFSLFLGSNARVTDVSYDVNITARGRSFLSEAMLYFGDSNQKEGVTFSPAYDSPAAGTKTYRDSVSLADIGLDFTVGSDGILQLEFFESVIDGAQPDSFWNSGSISFNYVTAGAIPEPATWAMMIGGFGMVGGAMRRRRVSTKVSFA
jgi:hypothetical protein